MTSSHNGDALDGATAFSEPQRHGKGNDGAAAGGTLPKGGRAGYLNTRTPTGGAVGEVGHRLAQNGGNAEALPFVDASDFLGHKRPLCVPIGPDGVKAALLRLDEELRQAGMPPLISHKRPHQIIGREVNPGSFGLYEYASQPQILLEPGKYPGLPFSNWIGCDWCGTFSLTNNFPPLEPSGTKGLLQPNEKLSRFGLTIVQVSQNQAAVCL